MDNEEMSPSAAGVHTEMSTVQAATSAKKAPRRSPGVVSAADLVELKKIEEVAATALREPYTTILARYDLSRELLETLASEATHCRGLFADAVQGVDKKRELTKSEESGKKALLLLVRKVQAAASVKYARDPTHAGTLKDYYIGVNLTDSAAVLAQHSEAILEKLGEDTLPGVSTATITALHDTRAQWWSAHTEQQAAQDEATRKRTEGKSLLATLTDQRIRILYAIEAESPYSGGGEENKAARAAFGLPATRPFRATRG